VASKTLVTPASLQPKAHARTALHGRAMVPRVMAAAEANGVTLTLKTLSRN